MGGLPDHGRRSQTRNVPSLHRQPWRIRAPCSDRRLTVVFAYRAATVAPSVNPPEQRPSVSAATAHRRSAPPSSTAMMAGARLLGRGDAD